MDSNDFGGKIVIFGNNVCRRGKAGERWTIWVYHSPRELGMGLLETWPQHVDLCRAINLFQRLEKNKRIKARRERQQSL